VRIKKFADLQTRIFNFVKYTKTLSVRNQHDTESRAFFLRYATRLTFEHTICCLVSLRAATARALSSQKALAANSGENFALQSAPYSTWVSLNRSGSG
jgi:hypothetical protein